MMNHHNGQLPRTLDANGNRKRGDDALAHELTSILNGTIARNRRYVAAGGFRANFEHFIAHLDDDPDLARRVLLAAHFVPSTEGGWIYRRGCWHLHERLDFDILVDVVNYHRPI